MEDLYNEELLEAMSNDAKKKLGIEEEVVEEAREDALDSYNLDNIDYNEDLDYDDLNTISFEEDDSNIGNVNTLFEGGPTEAQLGLWKKTYPDCLVFASEISGQLFIARSITRLEYKKLISLPVNQLQREEIICSTCVLFPFNVDWKNIDGLRGGIPSTLAAVIMENSGFSDNYSIQIL